jgi:hypothetical protein
MPKEDKRLQENLEGRVDPNEEEKESAQLPSPKVGGSQPFQANLTSDSYLNEVFLKTLRQQNISHEGQIHIAENLARFKTYFVDFLKKFEGSNKKVTINDVEEFKRGLEHIRDSVESW